MACGADWGEFGNQMGSLGDFTPASASERALGLQYPGQRAAFIARSISASVTRAAVQADILAAQVAGYK